MLRSSLSALDSSYLSSKALLRIYAFLFLILTQCFSPLDWPSCHPWTRELSSWMSSSVSELFFLNIASLLFFSTFWATHLSQSRIYSYHLWYRSSSNSISIHLSLMVSALISLSSLLLKPSLACFVDFRYSYQLVILFLMNAFSRLLNCSSYCTSINAVILVDLVGRTEICPYDSLDF